MCVRVCFCVHWLISIPTPFTVALATTRCWQYAQNANYFFERVWGTRIFFIRTIL